MNVTLLFSPDQYLAAAEAFVRGIERRVDSGVNPNIASVFISRWDVAVIDKAPETLCNRLGIAIAKQVYRAYRSVLSSPHWQRVYNFGTRPQRLLWASTGTKDPKASDTLYVNALAAPFTINTMPDKTLRAVVDHGDVRAPMSEANSETERLLLQFAEHGIDINALANGLQDEGANPSENRGDI